MTLAAEALSTGYGGALVGRDIDLAVRAGEVLCLPGPKGCGKTTLFKPFSASSRRRQGG